MTVVTEEPGVLLSDKIGDDEVLVHTHYSLHERCGVAVDPEESIGDELGCSMCRFVAVEGEPEGHAHYHYDVGVGMYRCSVCGYEDTDESGVQGHMGSEH